MDQKQGVSVEPQSGHEQDPGGTEVSSSMSKENPIGVLKAPWVSPTLEPLGPVCEATNGMGATFNSP